MNMSYCAFENTVKDLNQCKELLEEENCDLDIYEKDCSEYEKPKVRELLILCGELFEQYKHQI